MRSSRLSNRLTCRVGRQGVVCMPWHTACSPRKGALPVMSVRVCTQGKQKKPRGRANRSQQTDAGGSSPLTSGPFLVQQGTCSLRAATPAGQTGSDSACSAACNSPVALYTHTACVAPRRQWSIFPPAGAARPAAHAHSRRSARTPGEAQTAGAVGGTGRESRRGGPSRASVVALVREPNRCPRRDNRMPPPHTHTHTTTTTPSFQHPAHLVVSQHAVLQNKQAGPPAGAEVDILHENAHHYLQRKQFE